MPVELKSWPREHFAPGGGDALLFFAVFGALDLSQPLSQSKYRSRGPGKEVRLVRYDRATEPDEFADYQTGPLWDMMVRDAPVTAAESLKAPHAAALIAEAIDPPTLDYFRDAIGLVTWMLDCGGISVYDPQRLWLWSADEWRTDVFEPDAPRPLEHTVILVSEDTKPGTQWLHTRGLRQYGRPDVSVRGVGPRYMDPVMQMIERFIHLQAAGGVIPDGHAVEMATLPSGGVCRHGGSVDDPNFNNIHVAIEWPDDVIGQ